MQGGGVLHPMEASPGVQKALRSYFLHVLKVFSFRELLSWAVAGHLPWLQIISR